jgi:hypothetical protein
VVGPARGLVAIQNSTPAAAQQVGRLLPSSAAIRTGRQPASATVSSARVMPAANQPA